MRRRSMFFVFLWTASLGCGPQVSTSSGGEGEGDGVEADAGPVDDEDDDGDDGADVPQPEPDVGVPNPCAAGELLCLGTCIDPETDNEHCGRCDNECKNVANLGACEGGVCPPNFECGGDRTDYLNCNEVCEAKGTSCVDGVGCSGFQELHYGLNGVSNCEAGLGGSHSEPDALCSTPIDWEQVGGLFLDLPVAVSCCCL